MKKDLEAIAFELDKLSPIFQLINQINKNNPHDKLQRDLEQIKYLKDSVSNLPYETYKNDAETIHETVNRLKNTLNFPKQDIESISESLKEMKMPTPLELLCNETLPKTVFDEINTELHDTNWENIKEESIISKPKLNNPIIEFITKEPEKFASELNSHVKELNDDEINSVFTDEFLNEITESWWILPRITFEEYKQLSQLNIDNDDFNKYILSDYIKNPELIYDLIDNWEFCDRNRAIIIMQATDNYYQGNYQICVLTLLLQIEGLMRDEFESKSKAPKLRAKLEKKLNNTLKEKMGEYTPWDIFLLKSCKTYIWMILKPLCDEVNLIEDEDEINRNISAHNGKVEADQIIAIRLFLIIDTLMYLFEVIS